MNTSHHITAHTSDACGPVHMVTTIYRHRSLLWNITKRDIATRYRGSALGMLWSFAIPLLMLAVYTFVFGVVFNARFGTETDDTDSTATFALTLFCGLMIHTLLSDCLTRSPAVIMQHSNFVKKVVFPLEILPVMVLGSALFHFLMNSLVLFTALLITGHSFNWIILLFPLTILPLLPLILGMNWMLASLGVYIRDISQLTGLLSTLLLFLSPIFYPIDALPASFQPFLYANPLTCIIESIRDIILNGTAPNWYNLIYYQIFSIAILVVGFWCFQRLRKGFADII